MAQSTEIHHKDKGWNIKWPSICLQNCYWCTDVGIGLIIKRIFDSLDKMEKFVEWNREKLVVSMGNLGWNE